MPIHPLLTHQRQVHLDFHTSPFIPDVASEFDAREFARTFKRAHVNSVTVFAKCHHGMSYYPTRAGTPHPNLRRKDFLGEMIEALHREGIRAPIYTSVVWDELIAHQHPDWRQLNADGSLAVMGWRCINFLHPDYQDYVEAHVRELLTAYDADGFFFDIVLIAHHACWSETSIKFREKHGLLGRDAATHARFEIMAQAAFARRFTRLIRGRKKQATIFYNSPLSITTDAAAGVHARHPRQSHWEIESLPSGAWGYLHFPRMARAVGGWRKPWLGMTGRFQRSWGDFGGLKPQPALEYECFRSQAFGGANSIGDQLPPRGRLDLGAYDLIGEVYAQCEAAEPFYHGSLRHPQIGIVAPGHLERDSGETDKSLEGAVQMCEEAHYEAIVLDDATSFPATLDLLILPDSVVMTSSLRRGIAAHVARGGKVILSAMSAFDVNGRCEIPGVPLRRTGTVDLFPTYWRASPAFSTPLSRSDRVVYLPGENVELGRGATVWVERILPYFKRNQIHFSSHEQTPPRAGADLFPAVVGGKNFFYFADPIFREYRQSGNIAVRDGCLEALRKLIGPPPVGDGLPSTVLSVPRRRGRDLILTLLHYIPTRKALDIDMIEERSSFAGESLRLSKSAACVVDFETKQPLARNFDGSFSLPAKKGRLLLEVPKFLHSAGIPARPRKGRPRNSSS